MPMYAIAKILLIRHLNDDVSQVWYADDVCACGMLSSLHQSVQSPFICNNAHDCCDLQMLRQSLMKLLDGLWVCKVTTRDRWIIQNTALPMSLCYYPRNGSQDTIYHGMSACMVDH